MPRQGRELELLIKRLEKHNLPDGAKIKSPDYIADKITGQKREVDATIRYKLGTNEILIGFECRDRNSVEDSTWIEQIRCKHEDLNTTKVIAISSERFTKPALVKAKHYGISARIIEEITENDLRNWISPNFKMSQKELKAQISYIMMHHKLKQNVKNDEDQTIELNAKQFKYGKEYLSIWEIMNFGLRNNVDYSKIPIGEQTKKFAFSVDFEKLNIEVALILDSEQPLKKIDFEVLLNFHVKQIPMKHIIRYSEDKQTVYEGFEHEIIVQGRKEIMSFFKNPETGEGFVSRNYAEE